MLGEHTARLMSLPGVVGTALGEHAGHPCIRVFVVEKVPAVLDEIPAELEGYPVRVEETGEFEALGRA